MEYRIDNIEDGKEITLSGSFTYRDHGVFEVIIKAVQEMPGGSSLVFDLSRVEFIDSAILGMFSLVGDKASERDVVIYLNGAKGEVREIMQNASFDRIFTFC